MPLGDATLFELLPRGSAQRPLALKRRHGEALALRLEQEDHFLKYSYSLGV